ncbi:metallophosphoesterase [Variovorax sp. ZS18.2.2]|uniref:LamG-like jellyroll fold domain-containing protein n=1 Tax=Variovorax sp. ZS18.2.2 TaxID=2971255 RepID=UPI0021517ECB|nr:LamG-like jellyroll fold domain-containing protein [Variovorax sp. ZS18.2.2]MCR6478162.1 metallophosphoesterase [Variovorax sp. ZS18.2.2]
MMNRKNAAANSIDLNELARVPETRRRELLKLMIAGSAAGIATLSGCGGGGGGIGTFPISGVGGSPDTGGSTPPGQTPPNPDSPAQKISSFTISVLPDTQFYPRYASEKMGELYQKLYPHINPQYDNPFKTQTQWIAQNARQLKMPFTIHLGDIVDQSWYYKAEGSTPWSDSTDLVGNGQLSNGQVTKEWELASQAMQVLEVAKCPYSICAGNHDVGAIGSDMQWGPDWGVGVTGFANNDGYQDGGSHRAGLFEPYLQVFPAERARKQATFGGRHASGFHEYHVFQAEGNQFLVLSMSWRASDDAIAWANQVIQTHKDTPVILVNHQLVGIGTDGKTAADTAYSNYMWDKLIKGNDQIFMAVSGHYHGSCGAVKKNSFGNDVHLMVVDYQMAYMGGNGLMRMFEFDLTNKKIIASSFSPWVPLKPADALNDFDAAWLTDTNQSFSLDIDFVKRFSSFNASFSVPDGSSETALTDAAKQLILTNYSQPPQKSAKLPSGTEDYPKVDGTLAHWRFFNSAAAEGDLFPWQAGQQIPDSSTGAKNPVSVNTWMGKSGDLVWSKSHHPLSSAPGSLRFLNATKTRSAYFTTDKNSALNVETFPNGYTIEAFVNIDPAFDANLNGWMGIIYRLGARSQLPGFDSGDGDCALMFAFSNLMEFQWEIAPTDQNTNLTCWSGGVSAGQWLHVAIVNDPAASYSTTMYVEGAPVLRNNTNMKGIRYVAPTQQIAIGCGQWDGNMSTGFLGNMGEIRIVGAPLSSDKWLTARAS